MSDIGRILIFLGVFIFVIGFVFTLAPKVPFLGKLPGDIFIKRDGFTFYFPLATSILISILLTLIINIFLRK